MGVEGEEHYNPNLARRAKPVKEVTIVELPRPESAPSDEEVIAMIKKPTERTNPDERLEYVRKMIEEEGEQSAFEEILNIRISAVGEEETQ